MSERSTIRDPADVADIARLRGELTRLRKRWGDAESRLAFCDSDLQTLQSELAALRKKDDSIITRWQAAWESSFKQAMENGQAYNALRKRIADAPVAIMDTRDTLGICAPTEADFPALYALAGKRVALVVMEDE